MILFSSFQVTSNIKRYLIVQTFSFSGGPIYSSGEAGANNWFLLPLLLLSYVAIGPSKEEK